MYKFLPILLFGLIFSEDNAQDSTKVKDNFQVGFDNLLNDKIKFNAMLEDVIYSNISQILNPELFILDIEFNHTCGACDDTLNVKRLTSILNILEKIS